jgi:hypothetical protein
VEDKISGIEEKINNKAKTTQHTGKRLKSERNIQELCDLIKRILGIEGGEKVQAKSIENLINQITTKNYRS